MTNIENGNGGEYHFSHDAVGRLTAERRPDNTDHFYRYGPDGQLTEHRETGPQDPTAPPAQRLHRFRYDEAGQLAWRSNDSAEWQYHYDAVGRMSRLTRTPTVAGAGLGIEPDSVQLRYDKAGNLLAEQGVNGELQYEWDALANLQAFKKGLRHTVWYSNNQSVIDRLALIRSYGFRGGAFWAASYESPTLWEDIRAASPASP